jgi:hypothetical protein
MVSAEVDGSEMILVDTITVALFKRARPKKGKSDFAVIVSGIDLPHDMKWPRWLKLSFQRKWSMRENGGSEPHESDKPKRSFRNWLINALQLLTA